MNSPTLRITVLVENTVRDRGLVAEHGLAYWIETEGRHLLFDTGQSDVLCHNARRLGIDLRTVDTVALSHGHYDHTGGLRAVLEMARPRRLVAHPEVFGPKFIRRADGTLDDVGMGELSEADVRASCDRVDLTTEPLEILPGVTFSGEIARKTPFEDTGGAFFVDPGGERVDPINDDAALFLDTTQGLAVVLGCAHSGVINTLFHAQTLFPGHPIHTVVGGMHLLHASQERVNATLRTLRANAVHQVAAGHCTGWTVCGRFADELRDRFRPLAVGTRFEFGMDRRREPSGATTALPETERRAYTLADRKENA